MSHKILYTTDVHGNIDQIERVVEYAIKESPDTLIIAGEIAPKKQVRNYIENQRNFLEISLPDLLKQVKERLPKTRVFVSMGNDDCLVNQDVLENSEIFEHLKGRIKLTDDLDIVGYPCVPITPFGIKDLEKYDLSFPSKDELDEYNERKKTNYRLNGVKSSSAGWVSFSFTPEIEVKDSIQLDLKSEVYTKNPEKTIYVFHAPPSKTNLDMLLSKDDDEKDPVERDHVGSFAIRNFIEKYQPLLTLHGHIHETVDVSGEFQSKIGNTVCMSSGNHNIGKNVQVLLFDVYNLENAKRLRL